MSNKIIDLHALNKTLKAIKQYVDNKFDIMKEEIQDSVNQLNITYNPDDESLTIESEGLSIIYDAESENLEIGGGK